MERFGMARNILLRKQLRARVPYSDTQIWRLEKQDKFPHRIKLSEARVGWFEDEIDAWIAERVRGGGNQPTRRRAAA
jgi:predicted DNA-binding transcriptional regulator AlpA